MLHMAFAVKTVFAMIRIFQHPKGDLEPFPCGYGDPRRNYIGKVISFNCIGRGMCELTPDMLWLTLSDPAINFPE